MKVDRRDPRITEELVFFTPAVRYILKSFIYNCRDSQNSLWQRHWKGQDSVRSNIVIDNLIIEQVVL